MAYPFHTIGHSTRSIDEFVALLRVADVSLVADVRTIKRSRTNPQFNSDALPASLAPVGDIWFYRLRDWHYDIFDDKEDYGVQIDFEFGGADILWEVMKDHLQQQFEFACEEAYELAFALASALEGDEEDTEVVAEAA